MRAIADRAGCTIGRLNHYFACREDMLVAALRHAHTQTASRMLRAIDGRSGRDALRAVLIEALPLDDLRRTEWKVWLTFWAQAITTESLRSEHHQRYHEWRQLVATLVAQAAPSLRKLQVERLTDVLVATVDGLGLQTLMSPDATAERRASQAISTAIDTLFG